MHNINGDKISRMAATNAQHGDCPVTSLARITARFATRVTAIAGLFAAALLTGCNDSDPKVPSTITAAVSADQLAHTLGQTPAGKQVLALAGTPTCGVEVHYLMYGTKDGRGESTNATGALMIPTGGESCTGKRPVVLYGHGTSVERNYNLAFFGQPANPAYKEGVMLAALYAAQGYIVVAPNYAGYDKSTLPYHPYLNAEQSGQEMVDALKAAYQLLPGTQAGRATTDSGKLFVTGNSEGGYVALAATRELAKQGITVTASAPLSGPYATAMLGDAIFAGKVNLWAPVFTPLLATGYQKAYGNLYKATSELFSPEYAANIEALIPGALDGNTLVSTGRLPASALFQKAPTGDAAMDALSPPSPTFSYGFDDSHYLVNTSYRAAYLADAKANPDGASADPVTNPMPAASPQHPLRMALKTNDLRGYLPTTPVFLCGGHADPVVFYANSLVMNNIWSAAAAKPDSALKFAMLDMDAAASPDLAPGTTAGAFSSTGMSALQSGTIEGAAALLQPAFTGALAAAAAGRSGTDTPEVAAAKAYHGLVAPFCGVASRAFFSTF